MRTLFRLSFGLFLCTGVWGQQTSPSSATPEQRPAAQQTPAPVERKAPPDTTPGQPQINPDLEPKPGLYRRDPANTITTIARAVLLDVTVLDHNGKAVTGLNEKDFVVLEDGVEQKLDSFHEHVAADSASVDAELARMKLPPNTFTNYQPTGNGNALTVILLDASNTPLSAQSYIRGELIRYMKTVPAGHPVAIFQYDTSLHLIQGFTSDPAVLREAAESKRDDVRMPSVWLHQPGYVGTQFRVENLSQAMKSMAAYLAGFPGRKNLVWFTASVPGANGFGISSPFPEIEDYSEERAAASEVLALSRVSIYPVDARGLETNPAFSAANRGMPSVYSTANFGISRFYDHSAMDEMAEQTGGHAFYNTNGLKQALSQVVDQGSFYYSIAYAPSNKNWDGHYRKIHIELAPGHEGLHLQYREGYYSRPPSVTGVQKAMSAKKAAAAARQAGYTPGAVVGTSPQGGFDRAMMLGAIPPTEIVFNTSLTAGNTVQKLPKDKPMPEGVFLADKFRGKPIRNYAIRYGISPRAIRFTTTPDGIRHAQVMTVVVVFDDKGEQINGASLTTSMDLKPETYKLLMQRGLGAEMTIAVPEKGNYFLRFGVHDVNSNHVGAMEVPVDAVQLGVAGYGQQLAP